MIRSTASSCSSDASSLTTTPTVQLPALRFDGKMLTSAILVPLRSTSSRFPSVTSKTRFPWHSPFGPVGGPSVGHGQSSWHEQVARYVPEIRQAILRLLSWGVVTQPKTAELPRQAARSCSAAARFPASSPRFETMKGRQELSAQLS